MTLRAIRRAPCPTKCRVLAPALCQDLPDRGDGSPWARPQRKGLGVPACPRDALVFQTRNQGPGEAEGVACWSRNWGRHAMLTRGRNQEAEGTDSSGITGFQPMHASSPACLLDLNPQEVLSQEFRAAGEGRAECSPRAEGEGVSCLWEHRWFA